MPQKKINFEINLTKMKWCPKRVSEVPEIISRAFERDILMKQIQPIIGTDHVKEWILKEDKDIPEFYKAPTMMQEWIAEKLIRVKIPDGIMPKDFVPKKCKILATGDRVAKFFGEDIVSTRTVESSLKLFDCGHFYLKQTLPGSGASPHWTIFEGRWRSTERGLRLEYLLRYSWQLPSSRRPHIDFAIEACRSDLVTSLAWEGETEKQLNGNLPAIVGTEEFFWAELVREGDTKGEAKLRWNEDGMDPVSSKDWPGAAEPVEPSSPRAPAAEDRPRGETTGAGCGGLQQRRFVEAPKPAAAATRPAAPAANLKPGLQAKPLPAGPFASAGSVLEEDGESALPLYIGFAIFVVMAFAFAYFTWEERS